MRRGKGWGGGKGLGDCHGCHLLVLNADGAGYVNVIKQ